LPNLDDMTGVLVRPLQLLRARPRNTLDRLVAYEGFTREELFPAPSGLPRVRTRDRWSLPGFDNEDLSFASLHEPIEPLFREHYHARSRRIQTVYARRIRPKGTAGRPRLLYIHGYMQPETVIEEHGLLSAMARSLDMEIVHLQPPYHGRRKPRSSPYDGERYWTADVVRSFEAMRQTILDARTLLSVMLGESPGPVGVAGLSLGGAFAATLACLEPRFDFSAPLVAHMDMGALLRDAPVLGAMRKDLARFGWGPGPRAVRLGPPRLRRLLHEDRMGRASTGHPRGPNSAVGRRGRSLLRRGRPSGDVEPMGRARDPLVPVPHMVSATGHLRRFVNGLSRP